MSVRLPLFSLRRLPRSPSSVPFFSSKDLASLVLSWLLSESEQAENTLSWSLEQRERASESSGHRILMIKGILGTMCPGGNRWLSYNCELIAHCKNPHNEPDKPLQEIHVEKEKEVLCEPIRQIVSSVLYFLNFTKTRQTKAAKDHNILVHFIAFLTKDKNLTREQVKYDTFN